MVSITIISAEKAPAVARALNYVIKVSGSPDQVTIGHLKKEIARKFPKFDVTRQKLTLPGSKTHLPNEATLQQLSIENGAELTVKDLGPQISWRTVFLTEYFGPLWIHPLVYHAPKLFYGKDIQHSELQKYVYAMVMLHYIKRELETILIHHFSHDTMPFMNIFKKYVIFPMFKSDIDLSSVDSSIHYWLFSGISLAYGIYSPTYSETSSYIQGTIRENPQFLMACGAIWLFAEISNLHTHLTLRALRPPGTRTRAIPYGYGFSLVSFPNYFFETLGWIVICVMTGSWASYVFCVIGGGQMLVWANKKHRAYKKEFGKDYPRGRKAMIPFIF